MQPELRRRYNAAYDAALVERYTQRLESTCGPIGFRLAETPVFFDATLVEACERAAGEIVAQLAEPARLARMEPAVPARFASDDGSVLPQCAVVDFGIERDAAGRLVPRVVELQGFPSLYAFEAAQRDAWAHEIAPIFPEIAFSSWFGGLDRDGFLALLRETIVGDADPACTVLVDVEPDSQKTACDFVATRGLLGVEAVDPRALVRRGSRLFRRDSAGRDVPVERIYNRLVGDDLARVADALPFDVRDALELRWVPHPRWFWLWSKASLPYLDHPAVPRTTLLSELDAIPPDVAERYVLKPLFSFAGGGVDVHPTAAACAAIPADERAGWCLQEKIAYDPALRMPDGDGVKVEVRVMFLRPDRAPELRPATNLVRLSRGDMHGVDHNKDRTWVGSSIGMWPIVSAT